MKRYLLWLTLVFAYSMANAQKVISNDLNASLYDSRIKLVDEFFDRFNGKEGHPDISKKTRIIGRKT